VNSGLLFFKVCLGSDHERRADGVESVGTVSLGLDAVAAAGSVSDDIPCYCPCREGVLDEVLPSAVVRELRVLLLHGRGDGAASFVAVLAHDVLPFNADGVLLILPSNRMNCHIPNDFLLPVFRGQAQKEEGGASHENACSSLL